MQSAAQAFFASPRYAVAGASSNPSKFGHKLFAWYLSRDLTVEPLNPGVQEISVRNRMFATTSSPSELLDPSGTSLSIVTPPNVTAGLLRDAKAAGIAAVWLQPGTYGDDELKYALREFPGRAVAGFDDGTRGGEGWCVLVDGDDAIKRAGGSRL